MVSITDRCYSIVVYLLKQKSKVTVKQIAKYFNVSERTIRYDLDIIGDWLKENGVKLVRKSRVGIWIEDVEKAKEILKEKLDVSTSYMNQVFTDSERRRIILSLLFKSEKPLYIRQLADELNVSRTTIIKDIDKVEKWLNKKNIKLVRKPNYGIQIQCDEASWRKAVTDYFYENFDKSSMLNLLNVTKLKIIRNSRLDSIIARQINELFDEIDVAELDKYITFIEKELNIKFVDAAYAGLALHISLALRRLKEGKKIEMPDSQLVTLKKTREFQIAKLITDKLGESYNLKIPDSEIGNITLHILGAKVRKDFVSQNNFDVQYTDEEIKLMQQFIENVSIILQIDLNHDDELKDNLLLHIKPMLKRLRYGLSSFNPLLNQIKTDYSQIYEASKKASKVFEDVVGFTLNEDEIGYLALHVAASLEKRRNNGFKLKVIVVCSTGIGTSKLLSNRLRKEFPEFSVIKESSLADLEQNITYDIDVIITTVPIENLYFKPIINVSPLLTQEDITRIENFIGAYRKYKRRSKKIDLTELLNIIERYCIIRDLDGLKKGLKLYFNIDTADTKDLNLPKISDFLNEKTVKVNVEVNDWKDAIKEAGQILLNEGTIEPGYIDAMIEMCESMDAYIVIRPGVAIAHARIEDGVNKTSMSLITLKNPVEFKHPENDPVKIVVALAAKDEITHVRALNELSDILDKGSNILEITKCKKVEEILKIINSSNVRHA